MRGARKSTSSRHTKSGIIPADSGSTEQDPSCRYRHEDHPRGCGEHFDSLTNKAAYEGSSPRMRGALHLALPPDLDPRIIPADAGSTDAVPEAWCWTRDHPRGCGEHIIRCWIPVCPMGSSPRMRGAPPSATLIVLSIGIIPADAGSTKPSIPQGHTLTDHPRGCGEHAPNTMTRLAWLGSSPRMRGAPHLAV